jgi:hypothetical protein
MKPVSPVLLKPEFPLPEIVIGKDQEEYLPLPCLRSSDTTGLTTMRWRLSWKERLCLLWTGNLYIQVLTFHKPMQPIKPLAEEPEIPYCM